MKGRSLRFALLLASAASCVEEVRYERPVELELIAPAEATEIRRGESGLVTVSVERGEGFTGPVLLDVTDLPEGIAAEPGEIAGESRTGSVRVRVDGARPGLEVPITIVARAGGATREVSVRIFVLGKPGTIDHYGTPIFMGNTDWIPIQTVSGALVFSQTYHLQLADLQGHGDPAYGGGDGVASYFADVLAPALFLLEPPKLIKQLRDRKLLVVAGYGSFAAGDGPQGIMLFRLTPEGVVDGTYGANGASFRSRLVMPGFTPRDLVVNQDESLIITAESSTAPPRLLLVSAQGVLDAVVELSGMHGSGPAPLRLALQPDGKVVVASPTRALRFHSDLSPDLAFDERVIPGTGSAVVAPYMMTLSDGYLAGGSTAQHASLWRFNSAWRALPASIDGATASLSGTVVSAVENRGKVYVTLESSLLEIAAINPDGSLDREFGREGVLPLLALQPGERNVGVIPTTHSRMYQVVRNGERYVFYRIWN